MFRRLEEVIDAGTLDPYGITPRQRSVLRVLAQKKLVIGYRFKASPYYFSERGRNGKEINYHIHLNHDFIYGGCLDPLQVTSDNEKKISALLVRAASERYLPAGFYAFPAGEDPGDGVFYLYDVRYGINARDAHGFTFFDFLDESRSGSLGEGYYGKVSKIIATRKIRYATSGEPYIKPGQAARVVKVIEHQKCASSTPASEYQLMRELGYFKARDYKEVYSAKGLLSVIVMRQFPGENLENLSALFSSSAAMSIGSRISCSARILRELNRHFHDHDLLHHDIKPANIVGCYDAEHEFWRLKLVDLGLAIRAGAKLEDVSGTLLYLPPEAYKLQYEILSEAYAIARVIAEVFWKDKVLEQYAGMNYTHFCGVRSAEKSADFKLFNGLIVAQWLQDRILDILHHMTIYDTAARWSVKKAITKFENLLLDYYLSETEMIHHDDLRKSHLVITGLANKLDVEYKQQRLQPVNMIGNLRALLVTAIKQISDHPAVIHMFKDIMGIYCLRHCQNRNELLAAINETILVFSDLALECGARLGDLNAFYESIKGSDYDYDSGEGLQKFLKKANLWPDKILACSFDLDHLVELTATLRRRINEITETHEYHRQKYAMLDQTIIHGNMKL